MTAWRIAVMLFSYLRKESFWVSENVILALVPIIFFCAWFIPRCKDNIYKANLFYKVSWIAEKRHPMVYYKDVDLRHEELIYYIVKEQRRLNIPEHLCIDFSNENEKNYAEEILTLHKNEVIKSYFSNFLAKSKNIRKLDSLEYYLYSLHRFLNNELNEYKTNQDKIYGDQDYSDMPYIRCTLTDFGRTYYKLFLITQMFIENNEKTRNLYKYINPEQKNHITEQLEKNEVVFWRYRP